MSVQMYVADYDGQLPYAVDPTDKFNAAGFSDNPEFMAAVPRLPLLSECVYPYTRSHEVFRCPADTGYAVLDAPGVTDEPSGVFPSSFARLGMSYSYATFYVAARIGLDELRKSPSETWLVRDVVGRWHGSDDSPSSRRYNLLIADGHVKSVSGYGLADY